MGKIIDLSEVLEKGEKLEQIVELLDDLKDDFAELIQEYEDDGADEDKLDSLTDALDALEDAYDIVSDAMMDED